MTHTKLPTIVTGSFLAMTIVLVVMGTALMALAGLLYMFADRSPEYSLLGILTYLSDLTYTAQNHGSACIRMLNNVVGYICPLLRYPLSSLKPKSILKRTPASVSHARRNVTFSQVRIRRYHKDTPDDTYTFQMQPLHPSHPTMTSEWHKICT
jgi:hypothetical protein